MALNGPTLLLACSQQAGIIPVQTPGGGLPRGVGGLPPCTAAGRCAASTAVEPPRRWPTSLPTLTHRSDFSPGVQFVYSWTRVCRPPDSPRTAQVQWP